MLQFFLPIRHVNAIASTKYFSNGLSHFEGPSLFRGVDPCRSGSDGGRRGHRPGHSQHRRGAAESNILRGVVWWQAESAMREIGFWYKYCI